jgi:hypothetical protein
MSSKFPQNIFLRHAHLLRLLAQSQIGYDLRHLEEPLRQRLVQLAVGGGNVKRINEIEEKNSKFAFLISNFLNLRRGVF